jgi:hypothetical protein
LWPHLPRDVLDRYLGAVVKDDPSAAPLFAGFRETDNAVAVKPDKGVSSKPLARRTLRVCTFQR